MAESPELSSFFPEGFDLADLNAHQSEVIAAYMTQGSKESSVAQPAAKDEWWREGIKQGAGLLNAAKFFHVHADSIALNGRVGEDGSGRFPIGRCALREGVKAADVLGPEGFKTFTFDFVPPKAVASLKMTMVLCARDKITETPYFTKKNWREEAYDGSQRNLVYATVPWAVGDMKVVEGKLKGPLEKMLLHALTKADPVKHAEGLVVCEYSRPLYDAAGQHTQMLFGVAAAGGFGNLPGQAKVPTGGLEQGEGGRLVPATATCDVSWAVLGNRHRCFRNGACILTAEHEGSVECAAKNNGAGKNKFTGRRGQTFGGAGAKDRRQERRAGQFTGVGPPGPPPSMPPPLSGLLHRGLHEREGEVRNGKGKRSSEGESSQQVPPALRGGEPMQQ